MSYRSFKIISSVLGTRTCPEEVAKGSRKVPQPGTTLATSPSFEIKLTDSDKALLNKLDREHREKMSKPVQDDSSSMFIDAKEISNVSSEVGNENGREMCDVKAVPNPKSIQAVSFVCETCYKLPVRFFFVCIN